MRHDYVTYLYFRPNGMPLYVGYGTPARPAEHLKKSTNAQNGRKLPFVVIHQGLSLSDARSREIALIKAIGREDMGTGPLVNRTGGGEGWGDPSPEFIKRRADSLRGYVHSEETRARMSAAKQNILPSTREKMRLAKLGKKQSPEMIQNRTGGQLGKKRGPCEKLRLQRVAKFTDPARGAAHKAALCGVWITNGQNNRRVPAGSSVPIGWHRGRSSPR